MTRRELRIDLEGDERLIRQLLQLQGRARREARGALNQALGLVRDRAIEGLNSPPKTGRLYKRGGRVHRASAMGEYPASDTGNLARSISTELDQAFEAGLDEGLGEGALVGEVMADAEYAIPLEYKPQGRGGRPFLRRAMDESRDAIQDIFRALRGKFSA